MENALLPSAIVHVVHQSIHPQACLWSQLAMKCATMRAATNTLTMMYVSRGFVPLMLRCTQRGALTRKSYWLLEGAGVPRPLHACTAEFTLQMEDFLAMSISMSISGNSSNTCSTAGSNSALQAWEDYHAMQVRFGQAMWQCNGKC